MLHLAPSHLQSQPCHIGAHQANNNLQAGSRVGQLTENKSPTTTGKHLSLPLLLLLLLFKT
jgi:hypothetical protein